MAGNFLVYSPWQRAKKVISDTAYMSRWQGRARQFNFSNIHSMISCSAHSDMKIVMIVLHTNREQSSKLERDYGTINNQK